MIGDFFRVLVIVEIVIVEIKAKEEEGMITFLLLLLRFLKLEMTVALFVLVFLLFLLFSNGRMVGPKCLFVCHYFFSILICQSTPPKKFVLVGKL